SGSWDETVRIWDVTSGAELACLRGHQNVLGVSFSANGRRFASASLDQTSWIWNLERCECFEVIQGTGDLAALAFGLPSIPCRGLLRGSVTVIESASTMQTVAWFPFTLDRLATHPSGRIWAGSVGSYLCLFTLEGGG